MTPLWFWEVVTRGYIKEAGMFCRFDIIVSARHRCRARLYVNGTRYCYVRARKL